VSVPAQRQDKRFFPDDVSFRVLVNELLRSASLPAVDDDYGNVAQAMEEKVHRHLQTLVGVDDIVVELQIAEGRRPARDAVLESDEAKMPAVQIVRRLLEIGARI
jgi:hypothetical protein